MPLLQTLCISGVVVLYLPAQGSWIVLASHRFYPCSLYVEDVCRLGKLCYYCFFTFNTSRVKSCNCYISTFIGLSLLPAGCSVYKKFTRFVPVRFCGEVCVVLIVGSFVRTTFHITHLSQFFGPSKFHHFLALRCGSSVFRIGPGCRFHRSFHLHSCLVASCKFPSLQLFPLFVLFPLCRCILCGHPMDCLPQLD